MPPIAEFGKEYGWLTALVIWLVYQGVTRVWPQIFAASQARHTENHEQRERLEDRVFKLQEQMIQVIAANTHAIEMLTQEFNAHLGAMTRALDANTRVLAMLVEPTVGDRKK